MRDQPLEKIRPAELAGTETGGADANWGIDFPRVYDLLVLLLTRGRDRAYREDLLNLAGIAPGDRVLDVGCGTGTQAIAAWRRAGNKRRPLARDRNRFVALHAQRRPLYDSLADAVLLDSSRDEVRNAVQW